MSLTVNDALEFGKYFRFNLQGGGEGSGVAQSIGGPASVLDAFAFMHNAAADVDRPQLKVLTTTNNLLCLKNDFVKYLQEKHLGWSMGCVESHGTPFVRKMAEVLRHIDGQHAKLEAQQASIPVCSFNDSTATMTQLPGSKRRIALTELGLKHLLMIYMSLAYWNNHGWPFLGGRK